MTPTTRPSSSLPLSVALAVLAVVLLAAVGCDAGGARDAGDDASSPASRAAAPPHDAAGDREGADPDGGGRAYAMLRATVCDTLANSFDCARAIEGRQLGRFPGATRRGDTLRLRLEADTLALIDRPGRDPGVELFSLQDRWPERGYWVVQKQYYEGSEYLLVADADGRTTTLPDWPLRAPGGADFAVLSMDLVAGYGPNVLQVWGFDEAGRPTREWEMAPERWGPVDGRWAGPDTLRFVRRGECGGGVPGSPGTASSGTGLCEAEARAVRGDGGWRVESPVESPVESGAPGGGA